MNDLLNSPITWGVIALILTVIGISGKSNIYFLNIILIIAFSIGCVGIFRINLDIHPRLLICLLFGASLILLSWWIAPSQNKESIVETKKPSTYYTIADCTFDIIFQISEQDLKFLKTSKQNISNGTIYSQVDIFEKDSPFRFIQLFIMGKWNNTESRTDDSVENLTLFSLRTKQFMFSRKKATIGNAQSGLTKLSSKRKYKIQIRGSIVEGDKIIILIPTSATIRTHEGIVFPAIEFKRMDSSQNEYWQAEFPSIQIQNYLLD